MSDSLKNHQKIKSFGDSMKPILFDQDILFLEKVKFQDINIDDIICFRYHQKLTTHRVVYRTNSHLITKGDNNLVADKRVKPTQVVGRINYIERQEKKYAINTIYFFQSSIYLREIRRVLKEFDKQKVDYVILKGLPLHLYLEKKHPRRLYYDCDILVSKIHLNKARKILLKQGYSIKGQALSYLHGRVKQEKSEVNFIKNVKGCPVTFDIHAEAVFMMTQLGELNFLYDKRLLEEFSKSLLRNKRIVKVGNQFFKLLSMEDQIVYLFLHLFHHNLQGGYRFNILSTILGKKYNVLKILEIIKEFQLQTFIYPVLVLLQKYYPETRNTIQLPFLRVPGRIKQYISSKLVKTRVFDDELRVKSGVKRFLLLFQLSPRPLYIRVLTFLNTQVIYSIGWVISYEIKKRASQWFDNT